MFSQLKKKKILSLATDATRFLMWAHLLQPAYILNINKYVFEN